MRLRRKRKVEPESQMVEMESEICQICGDKGICESLISCTNCCDLAAHMYCLGQSRDDICDEFTWICDCCASMDTQGKMLGEYWVSRGVSNVMETENDEFGESTQQVEMEICQICGDRGIFEALMSCTNCCDSAVHIYCLGHSLDDMCDDFSWICDSCVSMDKQLGKVVTDGDTQGKMLGEYSVSRGVSDVMETENDEVNNNESVNVSEHNCNSTLKTTIHNVGEMSKSTADSPATIAEHELADCATATDCPVPRVVSDILETENDEIRENTQQVDNNESTSRSNNHGNATLKTTILNEDAHPRSDNHHMQPQPPIRMSRRHMLNRKMDNTDNTSKGCKKGGRGPTTLVWLKEARARGRKVTLQLNKKGKPTGKINVWFTSYLGVCVRAHVPITIPDWKHVDENVKTNMWEDIKSVFEFDEQIITKKSQMTRMSKMWRDHKSNLYTEYVFGEKKGRDPSKDYSHISPEIWQTFLKQRQDETFKRLRDANKERAESNKCPHTLSRGGYANLMRQMVQQRLDSLREELKSQGHDSSIFVDQVPLPTRTELWQEAKKKRSTGEYVTDESRYVGEKIDKLTQQLSQGEFVESGRKDILAMALGKDEHPGRVRGVGGGVGIRSYFGSTSKSRGHESVSKSELEQAIAKACVRTREETLAMVFSVLKNMAEGNPMQKLMENFRFSHHTPMSQPTSENASCNEETHEEGEKCTLYIDNPIRLVVAYGVLTTSRTLRCKELPKDLVKVRIDSTVVDDAPLPCLVNEEIRQVCQAKRTYVAWPRNLVELDSGIQVEQSEQSSSASTKLSKECSPK